MKKTLLKLLVFVTLCAPVGCAYSKVTVPLDTDVDHTVLGEKVGRSSTYSILYLVAWGDGGVKAAAQQGNITTVNQLDAEYFTILFGLYTRVTTIAYGD